MIICRNCKHDLGYHFIDSFEDSPYITCYECPPPLNNCHSDVRGEDLDLFFEELTDFD